MERIHIPRIDVPKGNDFYYKCMAMVFGANGLSLLQALSQFPKANNGAFSGKNTPRGYGRTSDIKEIYGKD